MKKGFTLIELLAVIVILAIIALIATPIILGIINDAREEANKRSVELYASAIKNAIATHQLKTGEEVEVGTYKSSTLPFTVEYDGDITCNTVQIKEDGTIYIADCTVNGDAVDYAYGKKIEKPCYKTTDEDGYEMITCGTESFYIIEETEETITMLSQYNLNIGDNAYPNGTIGIQNENVFGYKNGYTKYGTVAFSTTNYWGPITNTYAAWVYGDYKDESGKQQNIIYTYVESYEEYLKENGVSSASATLISYEQLKTLGCDDVKHTCGPDIGTGVLENPAPSWVYSTTYWTGSASLPNSVWDVGSDGVFSECSYDVGGGGVRPVITISTSEI